MEPHDRVVVTGKIKRLRGDLFHYTYGSIQEQVAVMNKYSGITADGLHRDNKPSRLRKLIFHAPLRFFTAYIL